MKRILFLVVATGLLLAAIPTRPAHSRMPQQGQQKKASRVVNPPAKFNKVKKAVPGQYIVILDEEALDRDVAAVANELSHYYNGKVEFIYRQVIKGFSMHMSESAAVALSLHPLVKYVEENAAGSLTQSSPEWHLDRIDQRDLPLDGVFSPGGGDGQNVDIYILDSGIRISHSEFSGRATASAAADFIGDGRNGLDCNGHGTSVASLAGGRNLGVARSARLHSVRIAGCDGEVDAGRTMSAIDWVRINRPPGSSAIINLSSIYAPNFSLDQAVRNAIESDITVVIGAGNESSNVANFSPMRVQEAVVVGATTMTDARRSDSNFGPLVDLFAPGEDLRTAHIGGDNVTVTRSGTSFAAPLVAGAIARWRSTSTNRTFPNWLGDSEVKRNASAKRLTGTPSGTANRLLFTNYNYRARTTATTTGETFLYRYYQPQVGDHFYTIEFGELGRGAGGYVFEWVEALVYRPDNTVIGGLTPLHRYYHGGITDHFYTTNFGTLGFGGGGWVYERIECKVFTNQPQSPVTTQLRRYYNAAIGDHFYTTNFDEVGNGADGWVFEGFEGWVLPQTTGAP